MPDDHPIDQVARAQRALDGLDGLLCLAQDSPAGTPAPADIAAIITPIAALLGAAVDALEAQDARQHRRHLRPVV